MKEQTHASALHLIQRLPVFEARAGCYSCFETEKIQSKPDGFSFKKNEKRSKTAEGVESEYNSTKSTACRRRLTSFCQRKHNHTFLEMKLVMTPEAHDASLTMILS